MNVHVFIGEFKNRHEAISYSQMYWDPEPDDSVSDEEYSEWENNNPKWRLRDDLGVQLESAFIETITDDALKYLSAILDSDVLVTKIKPTIKDSKPTLVLIYDKALPDGNTRLNNTTKLNYYGKHKSVN